MTESSHLPEESSIVVEDDFTMLPYAGPIPVRRFSTGSVALLVFGVVLMALSVGLLVVDSGRTCGEGNMSCQVKSAAVLSAGLTTMFLGFMSTAGALVMAAGARRRAAQREDRLNAMLASARDFD